jgi:NAD(P)-dependent dehydrogenase (short-subunit alcohol dehydrogenase family)
VNIRTLTEKRVLVLGAETEIGAAIASALAGAGADLALVVATTDAGPAFSVRRLSRRLANEEHHPHAQAIDATNEMAVRVMVRQVAKTLAGLDAIVFCADLGDRTPASLDLAARYGGKELAKARGLFVAVTAAVVVRPPSADFDLALVPAEGRDIDELAREVLDHIAGAPHNG